MWNQCCYRCRLIGSKLIRSRYRPALGWLLCDCFYQAELVEQQPGGHWHGSIQLPLSNDWALREDGRLKTRSTSLNVQVISCEDQIGLDKNILEILDKMRTCSTVVKTNWTQMLFLLLCFEMSTISIASSALVCAWGQVPDWSTGASAYPTMTFLSKPNRNNNLSRLRLD